MFYIFDMIVCGLQLIENGRQKIPLCSGATSRPHDGGPSTNDLRLHISLSTQLSIYISDVFYYKYGKQSAFGQLLALFDIFWLILVNNDGLKT